MNIELADASQTLLKITWSLYSPEIEAEIVRRLQSVPGAEGQPRRYYCPAIQCERLMQLFPQASFDHEALCAADLAAGAFYQSMIHGGIKLIIVAGKVQAIGDNVSPLVAQLVDDRSPALMSFVQLELERASRKASLESSVDGTLGQCNTGDEKIDLLARSIQNAQKRAEIAEQFRYGKRQGKKKPVQGELFRDK